jgi:Domain of unknown function (DUF4832)
MIFTSTSQGLFSALRRQMRGGMLLVALCCTTAIRLSAGTDGAVQAREDNIAIHYLYKSAPADNPLKGFVSYLHDSRRTNFPHSLSFEYYSLASLMRGPTNYDWQILDTDLALAQKEGDQLGFRVYLDFPGMKCGIPDFLIRQGLKTSTYRSYGNRTSLMPDYDDARLRRTLINFISALGARYDGDPRIAFIEAGLLGFWGEWHSHPETSKLPPAPLRSDVLNAYQSAFKTTKILVRLPDEENIDRPFGYHDDSFCWDTLGDGKKYMLGRMKLAGPAALEKWQRYPFGGELRPELWEIPYNAELIQAGGQDFYECIAQSHASWLRNNGAFVGSVTKLRRSLAAAMARRLGYEFFVSRLNGQMTSNGLKFAIMIRNLGVAPFYYPWPVEIAVMDREKKILKSWPAKWDITQIMPGEPDKSFCMTLNDLPTHEGHLLLRIANPMPAGKPIHFANEQQDATIPGWLTLLDFTAKTNADDTERLSRLSPDSTMPQ